MYNTPKIISYSEHIKTTAIVLLSECYLCHSFFTQYYLKDDIGKFYEHVNSQMIERRL